MTSLNCIKNMDRITKKMDIWTCAICVDSDQPLHMHRLIGVFTDGMRNLKDLRYPCRGKIKIVIGLHLCAGASE